MVYPGDSEERVRDFAMAMAPERSKPPLHNFNLPWLKWGNQKHLRCMKLTDSAAGKDKNLANGISADRARTTRSPPSDFIAARDYEVRRFKKLRPVNDTAAEEGIEAVGEKLLCDLKAAADELKASILGDGASEGGGGRAASRYRREREEESDENEKSPPVSQPAAAAAAAPATADEARPWNLRTRRAACKEPNGGNLVNGKALRIEERRGSNYSPARSENAKSPRLPRGEKRDREEGKGKETEQPRPKFSLTLSRKEIEEDFMAMIGHRPARRPKKRPRNVQKELDMLYPGLWLTEVTVDTYKVPELPENGKR